MKPIIPIGLTGLLFAGASFAMNPVCGFYGGLFAEVSYAPNIDLHFPTITTIPVEISYKIMGGGGGQLGYRMTSNFRVEVEGLFNTNQFKEIQIDGVAIPLNIPVDPTTSLSISGRTNVIASFINAYYDILTPDTDSNFAPYIGLGIGYLSLRNSLTFYENGVAIAQYSLTATETEPGAQAILGFSYFMDDYTWASMDYRYISTNTIKAFNQRYQLHTLNFSINFAFDGLMS